MKKKKHLPRPEFQLIKIRWVIGSVKVLIKKLKILNQVIPNSEISYIGQYVRIVCALSNAFRPPKVSNMPSDMIMAKHMLHLVYKITSSQEKVKREFWSRKTAIWHLINVEAYTDFPKLILVVHPRFCEIIYNNNHHL